MDPTDVEGDRDVFYHNESQNVSTWDHPCDATHKQLLVEHRSKLQQQEECENGGESNGTEFACNGTKPDENGDNHQDTTDDNSLSSLPSEIPVTIKTAAADNVSASIVSNDEPVEAPRVLLMGDPTLREACPAIESTDISSSYMKRQRKLVSAALQDFRQKNGFGRAIAAPQVGITHRMIAMNLVTTDSPAFCIEFVFTVLLFMSWECSCVVEAL